MEDSVIKVDIIHTSLVKPASPSPQAFLLLSPCDVLLRDIFYNRRLLFYPPPQTASGDDDYELFIGTLQSSLSQALAFFYPFAGRLVDEDGRLMVACNDEGAEFVQACIEGASFAELQRCNFDMQDYYVDLTRWATYSRHLHEGCAPLLSIQVTRFSCGSLALGISHSHVIADGHSLWHFMSSWAECARGEPLSLYPSHDRTPLIIQNPSHEMATIEFFEDDYEASHTINSIKQRAFSFSEKAVEKLKQRANHAFGSYEVLCAHIWKKVSSARNHGRNVRISFGNVVNMRGRLDPPLLSGFFGNVLLWGMATTTMGELQDEDLAATASRIRDAVLSCTNSRMKQLINFLHVHGAGPFFSKVLVNQVRLRVSSSPKFPVMAINFGWGKPFTARSAIIEEDGKLVFYPGPTGIGSADICIALPCCTMERLESDPSFL